MVKKILIIEFVFLLISISNYAENIYHKGASKNLGIELINSLKNRGLNVLDICNSLSSKQLLDSTGLKKITKIQLHFNLNNLKKVCDKNMANIGLDENYLFEDFEGDFPGERWSLYGDPTWGLTNYKCHSRNYSAYCASGGKSGISVGSATVYPNNMNAIMILGPIDPSDALFTYVRFSFFINTDPEDYLYCMASIDSTNFFGIGISGNSIWNKATLDLGNIPKLGNLNGQKSVWIAFGFTSDNQNKYDGLGAFLDNIDLQKIKSGTGLSGYLSGQLNPDKNPYIIYDDIIVDNADSLIIFPGCELRFVNGAELTVLGYLKACGTERDSILFTSQSINPSPGDWKGISCLWNNSLASIIQYARFEYAGYLFGEKHAAVYLFKTPAKISNSLFINNDFAGIHCENYGDSFINVFQKNKFINNEYGIFGSFSNVIIDSNIFTANINFGIKSDYSDFIITNNYLANNMSGVYSFVSSTSIINNTMVNHNWDGIHVYGRRDITLESGKISIVKNVICNNLGNGIKFDTSVPYTEIGSNIISGNGGNGIEFSDCAPQMYFFNNTIIENKGSGIFCNSEFYSLFAVSEFFNNIIYKNQCGIYFKSTDSYYIVHNNVFGNQQNFQFESPNQLGIIVGKNSNGDDRDRFFNISMDPLIIYKDDRPDGLQGNSPCIDAGHPDSVFFDLEDQNHPGFAKAPALGTTINDIGAWGGPGHIVYEPPLKMKLLLPENGAIVDTLCPTFVWKKPRSLRLSDPLRYELFIRAIDGSAKAHYFDSISDTFLQINENLTPYKTYDWFVSGYDSLRNPFPMEHSPFQFSTIKKPPAEYQFTLLYPANGDTLNTLRPNFIWQKSYLSYTNDHVVYSLFIENKKKYLSFDYINDTTFQLQEDLLPDASYSWEVYAEDTVTFESELSYDKFSFIIRNITSMENKMNQPSSFKVYQNYPNPFNVATTIKYNLPKSGHVIFKILNLSGQELELLYDNFQAAGEHKIKWNSAGLPSGIYFYQLQTDKIAETKKMNLLK